MKKQEWTNYAGKRQVAYYPEISDMVGRVFDHVYRQEDDELVFVGKEGTFTFYHQQDCCESVGIEDIVGDLMDLEGAPLLVAEESSKEDPEAGESGTWTFYKFATSKGWVDVRWYGSSSGYYSESVDLAFKPAE